MTKTDLHLQYQKEFGGSLDSIAHMSSNGDRDYVEWLEEKAIQILHMNRVSDTVTKHFNQNGQK